MNAMTNSEHVARIKKNGLEQQSQTVRIGWVEALYWFCWLALIALLVFIVIRQF